MRTKSCKAFTLIEVAVTIVIVALMIGTAMAILDRLVGALVDMRLHDAAFETARENMEALLSRQNVQDMVEYGVSEVHPEIQWQVVVEPFHEPVDNAMWVRAVSEASYTDSKGEYQTIELTHWLTHLPGHVVRQILLQQEMENEYMNLLLDTAGGQEEAAVQETTIAYLKEAGLDVDAYTSYLERQRRRKLDYISKHGFDSDYPAFIEELRQEEDRFLERLGMDFDKYNEFARTYEPTLVGWNGLMSPGSGRTGGTGQPSSPSAGGPPDAGQQPRPDEPRKVWTEQDVRDRFPNIPEELISIVVSLLNR